MTEDDWLRADDAHTMTAFLNEKTTPFRTRWQGPMFLPRFKVSERKWRLLFLACCDRASLLVPGKASLSLLTAHENYAEGLLNVEAILDEARRFRESSDGELPLELMDEQELAWARIEAREALDCLFSSVHRRTEILGGMASAWASFVCVEQFVRKGVPIRIPNGEEWDSERVRELRRQSRLVRDIMGNPFRPAVVEQSWLAWNNGTVPRIAQALYDERHFADIPILADALEDAGCRDAAILQHCRAETEHTKGCWVVDLLLHKK